jgi:hypothetical protein
MIKTVTPVKASKRQNTSNAINLSFKIKYPGTAVQRGIKLITKDTSHKRQSSDRVKKEEMCPNHHARI